MALSSDETPDGIGALILTRMAELGLTRHEMAKRLGYSNIVKGLRRVDAIVAGDLSTVDTIARPIADALVVPEQLVRTAISVTKAHHAESARLAAHEAEQAWRASFRPYATILTESGPSSITLYVMSGGDKLRTIPLAPGQPSKMVKRAMAELPTKLRDGGVPFRGKAMGFTVAFTADLMGVFTLDGTLVALERTTVRREAGSVHISGRQMAPYKLGSVLLPSPLRSPNGPTRL